jgi:hypothetical protein
MRRKQQVRVGRKGSLDKLRQRPIKKIGRATFFLLDIRP